MATYEEWNRALGEYFVSGVAHGSAVYLAVDEEALASVGRAFTPTEGEAASVGLYRQPSFFTPASSDAQHTNGDRLVEDFCQAVRNRIVQPGGRLHLGTIRGRDSNGIPSGVAFLCAMVLAATHMGDDGDVSEINYFRRLHEVLGLQQQPNRTRPPGLENGAQGEEPLWVEWNRWLQEQGFLVSARSGGEGPRKYIAYPLSQALLRRADKDRLRRLFRDRQWSAEWDADTLLARVRREAGNLTQHLQEVLVDRGQRLQAVTEAIYEEYESWREAPQLVGAAAGYRGQAVLMSGLYREENPVTGQVCYYLYPRQRRSQQVGGRMVTLDEKPHRLALERPGWLMPIGPIGESAIDRGLRLEIEPAGETRTLVLPRRDFWVLVPDRENPDSGVRATWGAPSLGTPFLILCRIGLLNDLHRLREERLIEWNGDPQDGPLPSWVEVRDCMVVSEAWQGVFTENRELYEALQPDHQVAIGTSGGLRVPGMGGWLEGYGPQVTVHSFFKEEAEVRVTRVADECVIMEESRPTNVPFPIQWSREGMYRIVATSGGQDATWPVRIIAWETLTAASPTSYEGPTVGDLQISGAAVQSKEGVA
jgi:hypothetical protein